MSKCNKCGRENREEARFCRFCGTAIEHEGRFPGFYGKKNIEKEFEQFEARVRVATMLKDKSGNIGIDCLITGEAGTGKLFLAGRLYDEMLAKGISTLR